MQNIVFFWRHMCRTNSYIHRLIRMMDKSTLFKAEMFNPSVARIYANAYFRKCYVLDNVSCRYHMLEKPTASRFDR